MAIAQRLERLLRKLKERGLQSGGLKSGFSPGMWAGKNALLKKKKIKLLYKTKKIVLTSNFQFLLKIPKLWRHCAYTYPGNKQLEFSSSCLFKKGRVGIPVCHSLYSSILPFSAEDEIQTHLSFEHLSYCFSSSRAIFLSTHFSIKNGKVREKTFWHLKNKPKYRIMQRKITQLSLAFSCMNLPF